MPRLPPHFAVVILSFAPLFLQRSWRHAEVLLTGAILAPDQRTVTSILRITGLARERRFVNYHRVLNRAAWCPRVASRTLLGLLVAAFAPRGPVVLGIDDTIERRRGKRIAAKGIYRDPVRSSHGHFVKVSGTPGRESTKWLCHCHVRPGASANRPWLARPHSRAAMTLRTQKPNRARLAGSGTAVDPVSLAVPVLVPPPVLKAGASGICSSRSGAVTPGCGPAVSMTSVSGNERSGLNAFEVGLTMTGGVMLAMATGWNAGCSKRNG
jgi:hypothetical protein